VSTCAEGIIILSATKLGFGSGFGIFFQHGFDCSSLVGGVELVGREACCGFYGIWVVVFDEEEFFVECDESVEICVGGLCIECVV